MKKYLLAFLTLLGGMSYGQSAKAITGTWLTEDGKSKVEVYKEGDAYYGKVIWLRDNLVPEAKGPLRDVNNPDPEKRDRKLLGMDIIKGLHWNPSEEEWVDGEAYDPESGNSYDVYAWMENKNLLKIRGYIGFSLLGRTTEWKRVD